MSPLPEKSPPRWKAAFLLGSVTFLSFIYFYEGGGWNQNSRFDLLRAIVEHRTLAIDAYHENTGDKAYFQGHDYSDKAPGLVFLALPFALATRPALRFTGVDPESSRGELALSYVMTACAVALPTALPAYVCFFWACDSGAVLQGQLWELWGCAWAPQCGHMPACSGHMLWWEHVWFLLSRLR